MSLSDYFQTTKGTGVLSTADREGRVNSAVYARPRIEDDGSFVFTMCNQLSRKNLETNPYAAFLFIEEGSGYNGKRFSLKKAKEENWTPEAALGKKSCDHTSGCNDQDKFFVTFKVEHTRPLIGSQ